MPPTVAAAAACATGHQAASINGAPATWQGLQAAWARCVLDAHFATPGGEAHECTGMHGPGHFAPMPWSKNVTSGHLDVSHCAPFLPCGSAAAGHLALPIELRPGSTDH